MRKMFLSRFLFAVCTTALLASCGTSTSDMNKVRANMEALYLDPLKSVAYQVYKEEQIRKGEPVDSIGYVKDVVDVLDEKADEALKTMQPDGSWTDVDYGCTLRGAWSPFKHMGRTSAMGKAYCTPTSKFYHNEEMLAGCLKALDYWFEREPKSTNWWANEIGGPSNFGPLFLVLEDKLSPEQKANAVRYMERSKIKITGQNRVWLCANVMTRAMLINDLALFENAVTEMKKVIKVEDGEGVQFDWSFHQHGRQQQFGNYGMHYLESLTRMGTLFNGTKYAYNEEELSILRNYLLNGMSWVVWKGVFDVSSSGRQIFAPNQTIGKAKSYGNQLLAMRLVDPTHAAEYQAMYNAQMGGGENILNGINHFYKSDMTIQRTPDWLATLKMCSYRTVGTETVNLENMKCEVMANGALYIYQDGDEYNNIFPVWDFTRIPGVTTNYANHNDMPWHNRRVKGTTDFVGGMVDGDYGVSVMDVQANGLKANKSWFFTKDYILCLGSDITSNNNNAVITTVNQTNKKSDVEVRFLGSKEYKVQNSGEGSNIEAVLHGRVGYYFPERGNVSYRLGEQVGSWQQVQFDASKEEVRSDVFNMVLQHGKNPKGAQYSYVVMPNATPAKLDQLIANPDFTIIKHDDNVHAVRFNDGTVRTAFFSTQGGTVKVDEKIEVLNITEEGILTFRRDGNKVHVTYVDPSGEKDSLILTFKGKWKSDIATYDPVKDETIVEFDTKISQGKKLEAECEIIG